MPTRHRSSRRRIHPRTAAKLAWPRFWASQFDYAICWWLAAGLAASLGLESPLRGSKLLIAIVAGPILVGVLHLVYELLAVTTLGTTLGKSLFGLRVETQQGKRAEFARVLERSVGAWLQGSFAYALFPLATCFAWQKSREELRRNGLTPWDARAETEVTGPPLPLWHLSAGAALAIAAFGVVLTWQMTRRGGDAAPARADDSVRPMAAGPILQAPASPAAAPGPQTTGVIDGGHAVFPASGAQKPFPIVPPPGRPGADKSAEVLARWAEHTDPYLAAAGPERRAMFAWMVAGARAGLSRSAALALGIDTVVSAREGGRGVCWPADLPPDKLPKGISGTTGQPVLGIRCDR
jgi:uncharacterized RDD family membrane protein YckC